MNKTLIAVSLLPIAVLAAAEDRLYDRAGSRVEAVVQLGGVPQPEAPAGEMKASAGQAAGAIKTFFPAQMSHVSPQALKTADDGMRSAANAELQRFQGLYPGIGFSIDWDNDEVNAEARVSGSTRTVTLYGGLVRLATMGPEGIALVLAHEVGHHRGGAPFYPQYPGLNLSCEGQADYWGAGPAMRAAYPGDYRAKVEAGADQAFAMFNHGWEMDYTPEQEQEWFEASGRCGHPPVLCRRETYLAAANDRPKPACAGGTAAPTLASTK